MATPEPSPDWTAEQAIAHLRTLASQYNVDGMSRFGIETSNALGVSNAVLRPLARKLKRNHARALELWDSGIREARLLALFSDEPKKVTADRARAMAAEFASWEIVDHSADLFCDAGLVDELIPEFAADEREFVRRTAFAMMAWGSVHLKKRPYDDIIAWLPLIEAHSGDGRNFVKKAVNWALRQIGKRSVTCHTPALALAEKLAVSEDRTARWIGKDAVRELTAQKTLDRLAEKEGRAHSRQVCSPGRPT
ncbi:DNA alkylation repair protein [Oricola indica]|uniref:DNA alkylation repair protein n=1 Tax=Oricola indica TaxID=2872591 RepID=UPI003CCC4348